MPTTDLTKSRSVLGATELTLQAPIKRGLIPSLDARSYESRAVQVLATLHALGLSRREADPTPDLPEVADAIRAIRSFRLAVIGPETRRSVLLSVSFDGGWEPYMRKIWRDLGPLLDLIFCNCEDYLLSSQHSYPAYIAWVRKAQVRTDFYYEGCPITVADMQRLREDRGAPNPAPAASGRTVFEQARAALVGLYRLTDSHPPMAGLDDGVVLRRAARLLLQGLEPFVGTQAAVAAYARTAVEAAAWRWFCVDLPPGYEAPEGEPFRPGNAQPGIHKEPQTPVTLGRLVLVELDQAAAAGALIDHLAPQIDPSWRSPLSANPLPKGLPLRVNLAFTVTGLEVAGVPAGTLQQLPQEFREGMAARASVLGDGGHNHPTKWTLPQAWPPHAAGASPNERIELSRVHAVVRLGWDSASKDDKGAAVLNAGEAALDAAVTALAAALGPAGGRVLAVEPMRRIASAGGVRTGHFDLADGISQPQVDATKAWPPAETLNPKRFDDTVYPGDIFLGHRNGLNDPAVRGRFWEESSFLVIRKLRQDVGVFRGLGSAAQAKLIGRDADGHNLVDGRTDNAFTYASDPNGRKCPLFSHIRRANPRELRPDLKHLPRILRRGMSYGPDYNQEAPDNQDRGVIFMAYCASIAEQFELIQAWLAGGNSAGPASFSGLRDPLVGVAQQGDPRRYDYLDAQGQAQFVELPPDKPLVKLQWGLYSFVPSLSALAEIRLWARDADKEDQLKDQVSLVPGDDPEALQRVTDRRQREAAAQAAQGVELIRILQRTEQMLGFDGALEAWKGALEDPAARQKGVSAAVWAAVRTAYGGALRTPYGVLVASKELVNDVLLNDQQRYSVEGYNTRLAKSFGPIYLGMDDGPEYKALAIPANDAIAKVSRQDAFTEARKATSQVLNGLRQVAALSELKIDTRELVDDLLATVCVPWFGLPDGLRVTAGGWQWSNAASTAPPCCPAHFHAPSRYTFQARPGELPTQLGQGHGQLLKQAVFTRLQDVRLAGQPIPGTISAALHRACPNDDRQLATTLIGVMMGFLPTVDGNLRNTLYEWVSTGAFWELQARLPSSAAAPFFDAQNVLDEPLRRAMQLRPVPDMVWRTALVPHPLGAAPGTVQVQRGDRIVVGLISATQEDREIDEADVSSVFGGNRRLDPHPIHACPGYEMAIGVMWGFLYTLMTEARWRPTQTPVSLTLLP